MTIVLAVLGVAVGAWIGDTYAIMDMAAEPSWVILASVVALGLALRRPPSLLVLVYAGISMVSIVGSFAVGSSWALATWWPLIIAVVELGRTSPAFLMTLTATLLVRDAPIVALLQGVPGTGEFSGGPKYFSAFVSVIGLPLWLAAALSRSTAWWARVVAALGVLFSGLAVWVVLASNSRAALLALVVAIVASVLGRFLARETKPLDLRSVGFVVVTVAVLVPAIDAGLGFIYRPGPPVAATGATGVVATTIAELEASTPGGIRLALWAEAGRAMLARPLGLGVGSYSHVNHAYQTEPMLWSGSPHSIFALAAVETGLPGLVSLLVLVLVALYAAARRGSPAMPALLAGTAIMSLDVFSSMPVNALVWWAVVGTALGAGPQIGRNAHVVRVVVLAIGLVASVSFALRLGSTCGEGCEPIVQYGGLPRIVGRPEATIGADPTDPRWIVWAERYPLAYWLRSANSMAEATRDPTARLALLRAYPYQSAEVYVEVASTSTSGVSGSEVAACGLERFFDGKTIWHDWRSSPEELEELRLTLAALAGQSDGTSACASAGIPIRSVGYR